MSADMSDELADALTEIERLEREVDDLRAQLIAALAPAEPLDGES